MKLIIIAAGMGSRLSTISNNSPKILINIFGKPLINQLLDNCNRSDINDIVIVTGYSHHIIENHISKLKTDINIEIAYNPEWHLANGVSVLAAKKAIPDDEDFLISMSDHYYNAELLITMRDHTNKNTIAAVGSDYKISEIHDLDDGMKVDIDPRTKLIKAMSKDLKIFNAIDCGLFKCKYDFFNYLEIGKKTNKNSLSDACNILISKSLMGSVDIKQSYWIDIDTPEAYEYLHQNPQRFKAL